VKRVDPLALKPRDFVEEWITQDWREVFFWSESVNGRQMRDWHQKKVTGDFIYPTMHCPQSPDLWQVGIDLSNAQSQQVWFLVRWRPPYRFTMVNVSDQPSPACTEKDTNADDEYHTLFPGQEWR